MEASGLIVGLGNPGKEYESTRHNFGFLAVDALVHWCQDFGSISTVSGKNDPYELVRCNIHKGPLQGQSWFFAKPLTYMNKSGDAVQRIAAYYRITPQHIAVLHDELDLPLGRIRFKCGGGNAGHNGLKSIQQMLGTPDFYRLRLGVGKSPYGDGASYVLGRFSQHEMKVVEAILTASITGIHFFMQGDITKCQQHCNGFSVPETLA